MCRWVEGSRGRGVGVVRVDIANVYCGILMKDNEVHAAAKSPHPKRAATCLFLPPSVRREEKRREESPLLIL